MRSSVWRGSPAPVITRCSSSSACSTDIDELAGLCDRVVVFNRGRVSADLSGDALETHSVLEAMNTGA